MTDAEAQNGISLGVSRIHDNVSKRGECFENHELAY